MRIMKVMFGRTHAITAEGDIFKGRQVVTLACAGDLDMPIVHPRLKVSDGLRSGVGCPDCRGVLQLDESQAEGE